MILKKWRNISKLEQKVILVELLLLTIFSLELIYFKYYSPEIENTINGQYLMGISMLLSLAFSFSSLLLILRKNPKLQSLYSRFNHFSAVIGFSTMFIPMVIFVKFFFLMNYKNAHSPVKIDMEVTRKNKSLRLKCVSLRSDSFSRTVVIDEKTWDKIKVGDEITVLVKSAYLKSSVISDVYYTKLDHK